LVRSIEETFGGTDHTDPSRDILEEIMEQHNLTYIPLSNGKYTLSNKRVGKSNIKETLDRTLRQENIVTVHSSIKSKILHTTASDHKPVTIVMGKMENQGPLPFRYSSIWDSNTEISELFKEAREPRVTGSPQYIWETKLKIARTKLKEWARANEIKKRKRKRVAVENGKYAN